MDDICGEMGPGKADGTRRASGHQDCPLSQRNLLVVMNAQNGGLSVSTATLNAAYPAAWGVQWVICAPRLLTRVPTSGNLLGVSWEFDEVPMLVEQFGAEEVGRLYSRRCEERLRAIRAGRGPTPDERDTDPLGWVEEAVAFSDELDPELRLRMVVAATSETVVDEVLWCIGDQPAAHLAAVPGFARRLRLLRSTNPNVERLFHVMQDYYRNVEGLSDAGWWDDSGSARPSNALDIE